MCGLFGEYAVGKLNKAPVPRYTSVSVAIQQSTRLQLTRRAGDYECRWLRVQVHNTVK
jgi:hypothetical protein